MPIKDPEKRREYQKEWKKKNSKYNSKYQRNYRKIKNPNVKHHDSYYDFETHRELAMSSGIQSQREWRECYIRGFMPNGIYIDPERSFRRQ